MMHKKSPTSLSSPSCKINCEDYTTCWTWGYRLLSCIAESQSGMSRVYRAVQLGEGNTTDDLPPPSSQVTIKVVESENSLSQQLLHTVLALSQKLPPHANILDITHYFSSARAEFIVSQTCRLGSLGIILSEKQYLGKGMAETSSKLIISQVCSGLTHLKMTGIPHGRLSCHNILMSEKFQVKLCDYGFQHHAKHLQSIINIVPVSTVGRAFQAPEVLQGCVQDDFAADIWSLGVVIYVVLHGVLPFSSEDLDKMAKKENAPALCIRSSLSFSCVQLMRDLLTYSPWLRPDLSKVLQNRWLCDSTSTFPYKLPRRVTGALTKKTHSSLNKPSGAPLRVP
ncbi:testis-specific serine/threonine-protein kinase 3-like [Pomacea canaliculata]|uniref:testis-specific serine/threonine-protein kinase 3-like n=1 Tax=Pomacea canaliculata TaxID=400727 RepID=UPI000D73F987|nr:testis-specific serine/threonine-protein kinase 3-like [Pomacea canaliculata]